MKIAVQVENAEQFRNFTKQTNSDVEWIPVYPKNAEMVRGSALDGFLVLHYHPDTNYYINSIYLPCMLSTRIRKGY